ncbi:MAG: alpha/beta hydrolase, partial [Clostridia bacterium]
MPSKAVVIFKAIDKLFNPSQNRRRLTKEYSKDIKVDYSISYDKDKACTLDTYVKPCNKNKYPVLFYVHGGGFTAGDKKYRRTLAYWYAQNGFFVINVNHGLAPEYKFPSPLQQLVSALNWVVDNAEKY